MRGGVHLRGLWGWLGRVSVCAWRARGRVLRQRRRSVGAEAVAVASDAGCPLLRPSRLHVLGSLRVLVHAALLFFTLSLWRPLLLHPPSSPRRSGARPRGR